MKNLLVIVLLVLGLESYAQTEQGKVLLGGDFFMSTFYDKEETLRGTVKVNNWNINGGQTVGVFAAKNLALGINLAYNTRILRRKIGSLPWDKDVLSQFGAGPFIRYYFHLGMARRVALYPNFSYNYLAFKATNNPTLNAHNFAIGLNFAVFLNQKVSIDLGTEYDMVFIEELNTDNLSRALNFGIGVTLYLGKGVKSKQTKAVEAE